MKLEHLGEIDSTNDEVRRRAECGESGPIWISAKSQSKGRGRRGREWVSAQGNLFATGLYTMEIGAKQAANLSFIAAVAVRDTIANYIPNESVKVKWPNDILVQSKKVSGILLESWVNAGEIKIAIGIGINIISSPPNTEFQTATIKDFLALNELPPTREKVLELLVNNFEKHLNNWRENGFDAIRREWLSNAYGINESVIVKLHDKEISGVFKDLNDDGELLLELPNQSIEKICAGDVFFPHLK